MVKVHLPLQTPAAFSVAGTQKMSERWWTAFEDHRLDSLLDSMLLFNFDLEIAWQRLMESRAMLTRERSFLFPDFEASVRGEKIYGDEPLGNGENLEFGLAAAYELDLWGRIRSNVQAARYRAEASLYDYQAATVSISAETVRNWYRLTEAHNQLQLVNEQIEINDKALQLMQVRFGSGQVRGVDILRQRQLLESTRAQKITVESRIGVLKHQLAVLTGRIPGMEYHFPYGSLPDIPPLPGTGIPLELVNRRPDIRNAFSLLQAADRDLAAALSNRYPRLSLSASATKDITNADNLFNDWVYAIAGNLLAPVFYGGRLKAEANRTEAVKQQLLYAYGQAVLVAFREVEDALIQEAKQTDLISNMEQQAEFARQSYEQLRMEYFNGMGNYLDVLTALSQEQQLRRNLLSARMLLLEYRIALYRSLAGSFETPKTKSDDA
jgi:NodT family efflux transporter outer membrane factor (OMF) lipoprotein